MGAQTHLIGKKCYLSDLFVSIFGCTIKDFSCFSSFPCWFVGAHRDFAASATPGTKGKAVLNYLAYRKTVWALKLKLHWIFSAVHNHTDWLYVDYTGGGGGGPNNKQTKKKNKPQGEYIFIGFWLDSAYSWFKNSVTSYTLFNLRLNFLLLFFFPNSHHTD